MASVFRRTEDRIEAHVFLCILTLLLERVVERACGSTWLRLREDFRTIKIAQLLIQNGTVYQTTPGNAEARNTLKALKIELLPLDTRPFSEKSM